MDELQQAATDVQEQLDKLPDSVLVSTDELLDTEALAKIKELITDDQETE